MKRFQWSLIVLGMLAGCAMDTGNIDEEVSTTTAAISNGAVHYSRGLVRIDRPNGNSYRKQCSAFLIAPNMIATAAHCVDDLPSAGSSGTFNGMRWRHVQVRLVYKPSSSESMCLSESCRNADGSTRFTTVLAWWDTAYSGEGDAGDDFAIITRVQGNDFGTRSASAGGTAPRALSSNQGDFLRILDGNTGNNTLLNIHGYGAFSDTQSDLNPRIGWLYTDWWGSKHIVSDAGRDSRICAGDSGGPMTYRDGVFGNDYAVGLASSTDARNGSCPESGDKMRFTRLEAKLARINMVMDWADRPGSTFCRRWSRSSLPGDGGYYRCW